MTNIGVAARAVAAGPGTAAPPSFDGHGWLVVINMVWMTVGFVLFTSLWVNMLGDAWRARATDKWRHPVTIWRMIGFLLGFAGMLRFGIGASVLWGWNPEAPHWTGMLLTLQRLIDPVAATCGLAAIAMFKLSQGGNHAGGMQEQLRKQPFPIDMWASLPMLKGPLAVTVLSLIAAIGVVSTR